MSRHDIETVTMLWRSKHHAATSKGSQRSRWHTAFAQNELRWEIELVVTSAVASSRQCGLFPRQVDIEHCITDMTACQTASVCCELQQQMQQQQLFQYCSHHIHCPRIIPHQRTFPIIQVPFYSVAYYYVKKDISMWLPVVCNPMCTCVWRPLMNSCMCVLLAILSLLAWEQSSLVSTLFACRCHKHEKAGVSTEVTSGHACTSWSSRRNCRNSCYIAW